MYAINKCRVLVAPSGTHAAGRVLQECNVCPGEVGTERRALVVEEVAVSSLEERMGERIKARRELMGFTVEVLARRSGLPLMRLQAYEAGDRRVTPGDLLSLCDALGASPSTFLAGIADPQGDAEDGAAKDIDAGPSRLRVLM